MSLQPMLRCYNRMISWVVRHSSKPLVITSGDIKEGVNLIFLYGAPFHLHYYRGNNLWLALKGIELSNPLMALVVAVLSKSITPTGMSVGTPLCISEVKKVDNDYGNSTMQNQ